MSASVQIVQGIENDVELLKPCGAEARLLDVSVVGFESDSRVEFGRGLLCNLPSIDISRVPAQSECHLPEPLTSLYARDEIGIGDSGYSNQWCPSQLCELRRIPSLLGS